MAGGMILEEELSISFGNEADCLLPQNNGHCVVNIFEFTESQSNVDCKGIIYFVQSSFEYFQSCRFYNMGNPFQCLTVFVGKVTSFQLGKISCFNLWLFPIVVLLEDWKMEEWLHIAYAWPNTFQHHQNIENYQKEIWFCSTVLYSFAGKLPSNSCFCWELTLPPHL